MSFVSMVHRSDVTARFVPSIRWVRSFGMPMRPASVEFTETLDESLQLVVEFHSPIRFIRQMTSSKNSFAIIAAQLGGRALTSADHSSLLADTVAAIQEQFQVELSSVLQLLTDGQELRRSSLVAGQLPNMLSAA
jgi:hypothetical protein